MISTPEYEKNAKRFGRKPSHCANTDCGTRLSVYNDNKYCNKCLRDPKVNTLDNLGTSLKALEVENSLEVEPAPMNKFSYLYRLKDVMREKQVKNTELGAVIGIHPDRISGWRSCKTRCHPEVIKAVAHALDVSVEDLK